MGCACACSPTESIETDNGSGIMKGHAYGILRTEFVNKTRLIQIRNP